MSKKERTIPTPASNPEVQPYWDAAKEGKLLLKRNAETGQPHFYPRAICPFTGSDRTEWFEAKGTGVVYSYSVMRRAPEPYCIAYVTLDEGVTMMTNIVDCDLNAIKVGMPVKVVFKPSEEGQPVPCFAPA